MSKLSLGVQRAASKPVITGPADLRDQKWLDEQVAVLGDGIDSARSIFENWFDGRKVGRLHPKFAGPGPYIESLGLRLTLVEAMAALPNASTRQVAAVAGVNNSTVSRARAVANATPDEPSPKVIGADGKSYPGRVVKTIEVIEPTPDPIVVIEPPTPVSDESGWLAVQQAARVIRALTAHSPEEIASWVPSARRRGFAKNLRELGTFVGHIALKLEEES
jgi:hypothetical protein